MLIYMIFVSFFFFFFGVATNPQQGNDTWVVTPRVWAGITETTTSIQGTIEIIPEESAVVLQRSLEEDPPIITIPLPTPTLQIDPTPRHHLVRDPTLRRLDLWTQVDKAKLKHATLEIHKSTHFRTTKKLLLLQYLLVKYLSLYPSCVSVRRPCSAVGIQISPWEDPSFFPPFFLFRGTGESPLLCSTSNPLSLFVQVPRLGLREP